MAKCRNCNGCLRQIVRDGENSYLVCLLCRKIYLVGRNFNPPSLTLIEDESLTNQIISKLNTKRIE